MKKVIYTNSALKETYNLGGIESLEHAWKMMDWVAKRNNWNVIDLKVKII